MVQGFTSQNERQRLSRVSTYPSFTSQVDTYGAIQYPKITNQVVGQRSMSYLDFTSQVEG